MLAAFGLQAFIFFSAVSMPEVAPDSLTTLEEVNVVASGQRSPRIGSDASLTLDAGRLAPGIRAFGEADLLRRLQLAGGTGGQGDYSSGLTVDGMPLSTNTVLLNDVPVHFPYHFGGIFSVFSGSQYPRLRMWKSIRPATAVPATGAVMLLQSSSRRPEKTEASVNVGMLASSVSLRQPLGSRLSVEASARVSYVDALYKGLLSTKATDISYNFFDADLGLRYELSPGSFLRLFGHYNGDRVKYDDIHFGLDTRLRWHNALAGLQWQTDNANATIFYSGFANTLKMKMSGIYINVPSGMREAGARGYWRFGRGRFNWTAGASASWYSIRPQQMEYSGIGSGLDLPRGYMNAGLATLSCSGKAETTGFLSIEFGLAANVLFGRDSYMTVNLDPRLSLLFSLGQVSLTLHGGRYHQYVHQVGFSEIGMSSNFFLPSTRACKPQESWNFVISAGIPTGISGLRADADVYWKRVLSQPEYHGGVLDLLNSDYRAEAFIDVCNGYNTGGSISLTYDFGPLTAAAAYSFGIARRKLPGSDLYFTASSETRHSLKTSASYIFPGGHWTVNASFIYQSGRPLTPVKAIYFIGEYLLVEYGKRNSARMPAYHRLDLGASYRFTTGKLHHSVNIAIINAYGHKNAEISKFIYNSDKGTVKRDYISSLYRFLPSLSYTIEL